MKKTFRLLLLAVTLCMSPIFSCCSTGPIKLAPEYSGVDPQVRGIVDEFMWLSAQNNLEFHHSVTIGFKDINDGAVVGLCTYGGYFREIDIDRTYWNHSTNGTKIALLYHELTHCYCNRGHDYGKDLKYPESEAARIARAIQWKLEGGERPGYWDDGCPISLMYPVVVDNQCFRQHYAEYTKEIFDRCRPF